MRHGLRAGLTMHEDQIGNIPPSSVEAPVKNRNFVTQRHSSYPAKGPHLTGFLVSGNLRAEGSAA